MPPTGQLVPSEKFNSRDLGDEFLFFDGEDDRLHVLNDTARAIYLLCDGQRTREQIVAAFRDAYRLDEQTAQRDAQETLEQLLELGLISRS